MSQARKPGGGTGELLLGPLLPEFTPDEIELCDFDASLMRLAYALRTGHMFNRRDGYRPQPLQKFRLHLDARRARFEAGDGVELLRAEVDCADEGMPLADWIADALATKLAQFASEAGPHSLDVLFASPSMPASGARAVKARRDWRLAAPLYVAVAECVFSRGMSFDAALTSELKRLRTPLGLSRARQMVLEIDATQRAFTRRRQSLLEKSAKNQKAMRRS